MLRRTERFIKYAYRNNSIKPWGGGGLFKPQPSIGGLIREGSYSRGGAYSKGRFPEGGLIRDAYYGPDRRTKNELDKRAIK